MKENDIIVPELNKETIESMIYTIRGQKVMLDSDLARIYGFTTKRMNEQVKRNVVKFPEDMMFQITQEELKIILRSQNATAKLSEIFGEVTKCYRTNVDYREHWRQN